MNIIRWLNKFSIKQKIVLISMTASTIALLSSASLIVFADYVRQREQLVHSVSVLSKVVAFNTGAALAFRDIDVARDVLSGFTLLPHVVDARLLLPNGDTFAAYRSEKAKHKILQNPESPERSTLGPLLSGSSNHPAMQPVFSGRLVELSTPIFFERKQQGIFTIRTDLTGIYSRLASSIGVVLFSLVIALLVVFLVSRKLQKSVSLPIEELASAFRDVSSSKDYSRRIDYRMQDELGELAEGFNTMLEVLGERDRETKKLVHELQLATEAKSAFLAKMSHEIRTPLHGILGTTHLLMDIPSGEIAREYQKTIDHSAKSLLQIINDILDLSRIEADTFEPETSVFSVDEISAHLMSLFAPAASEKNLALEVSVDINVPSTLEGDARRITQVLVNLIGNAVKFTGSGSVNLAISLHGTSTSGVTLLFEVTDTGIGIQKDCQESIFDDFSQVDESISRRFGGTGLGLSVSKKIVELLGGEIGVDSIEGEGSRFWFRLPLGISSDPPDSELAGADGETGQAASPQKKQYAACVLLADDSDINRFIMVETLKTYGIDTLAVEGGKAAVEAVENGSFDLIILDIQMPDIDGIEAARRIRNLQFNETNTGTTPLVAFSANAMQGDKERFLKSGMDDYLSKPIQIQDLEGLLERWLGTHQCTKSSIRDDWRTHCEQHQKAK